MVRKRFGIILLLASFFGLSIIPSQGLSSVFKSISSQGTIRYSSLTWLHVDGKYIKNEYNQTVFLRGAAFGGMGESGLDYWNGGYEVLKEMMQLYVTFSRGKANVIRVCTGVIKDVSWSAGGGKIHPEVFDQAIDDIIALAAQNNIYIIVEFHGGLRYTFGGQEEARLGSDPTDLVNWFVHFADRYKNNPTVAGFEIYNEPSEETFGLNGWINVATQVTKAINQVNPNALIVVASVPWTEIMPYWLDNPLPFPNVVYGWDSYYTNWPDQTYKQPYWNGDFATAYQQTYAFIALDKNVKAAVDRGLPVMNTEFGWYGTEGANWQQNERDYLSVMNTLEINWYQWWWWGNPENLGLYDDSKTPYVLSPQGEIWAQYLGQ